MISTKQVLLILLLINFIAPVCYAAAKKPLPPNNVPAKSTKKKFSRDVNFSDHVVNGKYLNANEAVATIENEKILNDLLVPRKDFKDRLRAELQKAQAMEQTGAAK